jgi:hypothetical protein
VFALTRIEHEAPEHVTEPPMFADPAAIVSSLPLAVISPCRFAIIVSMTMLFPVILLLPSISHQYARTSLFVTNCRKSTHAFLMLSWLSCTPLSSGGNIVQVLESLLPSVVSNVRLDVVPFTT